MRDVETTSISSYSRNDFQYGWYEHQIVVYLSGYTVQCTTNQINIRIQKWGSTSRNGFSSSYIILLQMMPSSSLAACVISEMLFKDSEISPANAIKNCRHSERSGRKTITFSCKTILTLSCIKACVRVKERESSLFSWLDEMSNINVLNIVPVIHRDSY